MHKVTTATHNLASLLLSAVKSPAEIPLPATIGGADFRQADTASTVSNTASVPSNDDPRASRFRVGEVVNSRYEVLSVLGEGSMGVVYQAHDKLFPGRSVALKTMQRVARPEGLALFRAEFRALAELRHAHIAQVYDFEELSGQAGHLFTMEFIRGQPLDAALQTRESKRVWRAVTEMAEALVYVHRHGRLHLDIKPQNAMLAADGNCKLLDFGLVGLVFAPGQFAGTPIYMAPEILTEQVPDARCDLFSLGVSAYQLLTGRVPYSHTARLADLLSEKLERVVEFPVELCPGIPAFMRDAVRKLCALRPEERFASAREFLDATAAAAAAYGIVSSRVLHRLERSTFVGREPQLKQLLDFAHARLVPTQAHPGALLCCIGAPSGLGKSRLFAEARTILQSEGHIFLQGDAYDQDVGEYTALSPILLAASHLAHASDAVALIQRHGPELVKIVPEFGLPLVCQPSPAFSNGEAERERLIAQAASFLVELAQRRPLAVYLNDLQWAGESTIHVLQKVLQQVKARPEPRMALMISYRSDQVGGQPVERLLTELPTSEIALLRLQGLSVEQVGSMMGSMLLATVSQEIASQIQQATGGIPFLVEEATRWLLSQDALAVRNGACMVNSKTGMLDLHVEVSKGIVARAALQDEAALRCLQLLSVCARPIELEHLRRAMAGGGTSLQQVSEGYSDLSPVLAALEREQFVVPVAGNRPRYALAHDRIRESLYDSLSPDERSQIHSRLGTTFEAFLLATQAAELAVLAAVHQNAAPIPQEEAARTSRCDVNLRAAEVAFQAADFPQALTFLNAAEALLWPALFADHARGMRLTYQRALTFGAMLRHSECLHFAKQAIRHARNLVEESKALVLAIRTLTLLTRYDEAIDAWVEFCNRLGPQAKLPKHPGLVSVVEDIISVSRQVQGAGIQAFFSRVDEPEDPERDLLYELLSAIADAVFMARPMLFTRLPRQGMHRLIREGASLSCRGSVVHVALLIAITLSMGGKFELAIEVTKTARHLLDSVPSEARGRPLFVLEAFLSHLSEPLRTSPALFLAAASFSRQARDTVYERYSLFNQAFTLDWLGEPLDQVNASYQRLASLPAVGLSEDVSDWIRAAQHLRAALQGQGDLPRQMAADSVLSKTASAIRCTVRLRGAALGVWSGPYRAAEYGFPALLTLRMGLGGVFSENIVYFHAGLVYLAALRGQLPLLDRLHFKAAVEFVTYNVRVRARYNPTDYSHRIALLDAERLRTRFKFKNAVPLYETAARLAEENGWSNEAALVLEKFTEVLIDLGDRERARTTANKCIALYQRWQAWAKVEQMQRMATTLSHRQQ